MKDKRVNSNPSRFFLVEIDKLAFKFYMEKQRLKITKTTFKGKKGLKDSYYLDFKIMMLKKK